MKFRVTMKDPDVLYEAVGEAVKTLDFPGLDPDELEDVREARAEKLREACGRWFKYGEYLVVEVDTDALTCTVIPNK